MDMIELCGAHTADLHADAKAAVRHLLHGWRALRTGTSRASRSARTGAAGDTAR
jgi:hypothetical protein